MGVLRGQQGGRRHLAIDQRGARMFNRGRHGSMWEEMGGGLTWI